MRDLNVETYVSNLPDLLQQVMSELSSPDSEGSTSSELSTRPLPQDLSLDSA